MFTLLSKEKTKLGRLVRRSALAATPLLLLSLTLHSCNENEFPVSELPEDFEFIPPDDVAMLTATGGDQQVTLTWAGALANTLKSIQVTNQNTGETQELAGDATGATFTGLTNYTQYTFQVRTVSFQDQLSYGATISAKPFAVDNVKPGAVKGLLGYRLSETMAFIVWEAPDDIDVHGYRVTLGGATVSVDEYTLFASIEGDLTQEVEVVAFDYSGNESAPATTIANEPAVTIEGYDDGQMDSDGNGGTEYLMVHKDPIIAGVDGYRVTYFDQSYTSTENPLPETYTFEMPVNNNQPLWLDGAKTQGSWLTPVVVTLLAGDKELASCEYLNYNNVPGTLMLCHADMLNEEGVNVKRNNDGSSFKSNLGNFTGDGKQPIYGIYTLNVLEDGDYETSLSYSFSGVSEYKFYLDGSDTPIIGKTEGSATDNWDFYVDAPGPVLSLTKGTHQLKFEFAGGHNYRKLTFKKL